MSHTLWLITYDISNNQRLKKVHQTCMQAAHPLQYSVFLLSASTPQAQKLYQQLLEIADPSQDRLSLIPISRQRQPLHTYPEEYGDLYPEDTLLLNFLYP